MKTAIVYASVHYWDEALKYNETKDECDGQINMFRYLDK